MGAESIKYMFKWLFFLAASYSRMNLRAGVPKIYAVAHTLHPESLQLKRKPLPSVWQLISLLTTLSHAEETALNETKTEKKKSLLCKSRLDLEVQLDEKVQLSIDGLQISSPSDATAYTYI